MKAENEKNARTTKHTFLEAAQSASSSCPCLCPLRGHGDKNDKTDSSERRKEGLRDGKRGLRGYMTVEAAMIYPAVFALLIMLLYAAFFLYDKCRMTQDLYTAAYRVSIDRSGNTREAQTDTSAYFMLHSCEASVSGGSTVRAAASGEMAPALLTGTGEEGRVWELSVTMQARKSDPPQAFRRYRRIAAIARMALAQGTQ